MNPFCELENDHFSDIFSRELLYESDGNSAPEGSPNPKSMRLKTERIGSTSEKIEKKYHKDQKKLTLTFKEDNKNYDIGL